MIMDLLLLLGYISFYARYTIWSGDFAWGDRYVSTAVELAAFISVPLLLRWRASSWESWCGGMGIALIAFSSAIQLASLAFWLPLEIYQEDTLGHPTFVVFLRFKNIDGLCVGQDAGMGAQQRFHDLRPVGLRPHHTWNFLPFLLRRVGVAPRWAVNVMFAVWGAGLEAVLGTRTTVQSVVGRGS